MINLINLYFLGKYYLGDAGFPLKSGLLTPYRGVRYHLKEYSTCGPQNAKEIFNHRHASLRTVIERAFGVLKKRFPIIASGTEPYYSLQTMTDITIACCILHNFLMDVDPNERLIDEVDRIVSFKIMTWMILEIMKQEMQKRTIGKDLF